MSGFVQDDETTTLESSAAVGETSSPPVQATSHTFMRRLLKISYIIIGMFLFILSLRMLSKGAGGLGPVLKDSLGIESAVNTLGFGWLFAYGVLSGSPVASISLSFLDSGVITPLQTFTMITGSRLGASFIVLVIGFIYYLRGQNRGASISIGILALSVTATTYLPALAVGYWLLESGMLDDFRLSLPPSISSFVEELFDPIVEYVFHHTNNLVIFLLGIGVLLVAFNLLDRALPHVDAEHNAFGDVGRLIYRPAAMFLLGAFVTTLTLSVSVSLSILVPLSARGFIRRENTLPYIMGANITTFIDTLIASLLFKTSAGFVVVMAEIISIAVVSLFILIFLYRPYERMILQLLDRVVQNTSILIGFMILMVVTPILLLLV